jgi:xanthine dehydrogenase large subunit
MKSFDAYLHTRGESIFVDDIIPPKDCLYAAILSSSIAHGKITKLNTKDAESRRGVNKIITYKDIPGENQIGGIIPDEPLLSENIVDYAGQPIAIIVAETSRIAHDALERIVLNIDELPAIFDPREAFKRNQLIIPPRIFNLGDIEKAWDECDIVIEDSVESGSQEHVYLETQGALTIPGEKLKVFSATQGPTNVQKAIAKVLGLPMSMVEVDTQRIGGGFGGKEDQATSWAAMTALAAYLLNKPVKLVLQRSEDMRMTGKRHPYSSDFKIGLKNDGRILAYEVTYYQNAGAAADLSTAILERTLFHSTNSYFIPNVKATAISCRTNLPPFTAFRGFGGPQAMFVLESAIYKASTVLKLEPEQIQKINLLSEGDHFPYGQKVKNCNALKCWEQTEKKFNIKKIKNDIESFNNKSKINKKGFALMPICFGISFTNTTLNQASALVNVYSDGSVGISTAAIEMGQGVNMKIIQTAARIFSIPPQNIKIETTNTSRIANTSPTAASSGADLNGKATEIACNDILQRIKQVAADQFGNTDINVIEIIKSIIYNSGITTDITWKQLVGTAYQKRISLSSHAHYATPEIYFDRKLEKGNPFAYHVFGTAIIEVTIDCLRGTYEIDSVKVVHDAGQSINLSIDRGQTEGGIVQGLGWMTIEEIRYNNKGRLLSDSLTNYKVPDIYFSPKDIQIHFLEDSPNPNGLLYSKAIGEPPLMYGIGVYFALLNAMRAFKPYLDIKFNSPLTQEKVFNLLYPVT